MKRYRFLQAVEEALPSLRTMLKGKSLTDNEANGSSATWYTGSSRERRSQRCRKKISSRSCDGQRCGNCQGRRESIAHAAKFVQLADPGEADTYTDDVQEDREMS